MTEAIATGIEATSTGCEAAATVAEATSTGSEFTLTRCGNTGFKTVADTLASGARLNRYELT